MLENQIENIWNLTMALVLQPGDNVPAEALPQQKGSKHLTIGPGLQYTPPSTIKATAAGSLLADGRKNAIWLENNGGGRVSLVSPPYTV